jgi:hypothetical protein
MHATPAFRHASTSQTVSPTNTAWEAGTPALSKATSTRSGSGLLASTSPEYVASSIASSASRAARSAPNSASSAELARTTARPRRLQARSSPAAPGSGLSRVQYAEYRALWAVRMSASACLSRPGGSSSSSSLPEPIPMARWMSAIGTWCPAIANASHQVTACR